MIVALLLCFSLFCVTLFCGWWFEQTFCVWNVLAGIFGFMACARGSFCCARVRRLGNHKFAGSCWCVIFFDWWWWWRVLAWHFQAWFVFVFVGATLFAFIILWFSIIRFPPPPVASPLFLDCIPHFAYTPPSYPHPHHPFIPTPFGHFAFPFSSSGSFALLVSQNHHLPPPSVLVMYSFNCPNFPAWNRQCGRMTVALAMDRPDWWPGETGWQCAWPWWQAVAGLASGLACCLPVNVSSQLCLPLISTLIYSMRHTHT